MSTSFITCSDCRGPAESWGCRRCSQLAALRRYSADPARYANAWGADEPREVARAIAESAAQCEHDGCRHPATTLWLIDPGYAPLLCDAHAPERAFSRVPLHALATPEGAAAVLGRITAADGRTWRAGPHTLAALRHASLGLPGRRIPDTGHRVTATPRRKAPSC
ncbi:MAG: hypothetical protein JWM31_1196 [Solirubrobacterales bacterium]|nr:hypothetical protein [Solirubrobacterales bacterium]